jgi:hypothetical protein
MIEVKDSVIYVYGEYTMNKNLERGEALIKGES